MKQQYSDINWSHIDSTNINFLKKFHSIKKNSLPRLVVVLLAQTGTNFTTHLHLTDYWKLDFWEFQHRTNRCSLKLKAKREFSLGHSVLFLQTFIIIRVKFDASAIECNRKLKNSLCIERYRKRDAVPVPFLSGVCGRSMIWPREPKYWWARERSSIYRVIEFV